jgi:hypothetical protein
MATKKIDDDVVKEIIEATPTKPTRGRGGKNNFPNAKVAVATAEDRALVSKLLNEVLVEYRQPKVKSDEELAERLNDYFMRCAETGQIPTVEEMCLSTGYAYSTCYDLETGRRKGFSDSTADIIKKEISSPLGIYADAYRRSILHSVEELSAYLAKISPDVTAGLQSIEDPAFLADFVPANLLRRK